MTLCAIVVLMSCQQSIDVEKEKEAIKAVIESSGQAWLDRDYEAMKEIWLQSDMSSRIGAGPGGYMHTQGYKDRLAWYEQYFDDNPEASDSKELFENYRISVRPEMAWALVDHAVVDSEGDTLNYGLFTYILEKKDGKWKLALLSSLGNSGYDIMQNNLAVSEAYHLLNPDNFDDILTDNFIRRDEIGGTWNKEIHRAAWTKNRNNMADTIIYQAANGNMVSTRFMRKGTYNGERLEGEALQIKRFEDGKIAEIWEYGFGVFKQ